MKKILILSLTCLIVSFLVGCDFLLPEEPEVLERTIVKGQVTEFGSTKVVPNAQIVLMKTIADGTFSNNLPYPVDTISTDKDGRYSIEYDDVPSAYHNIRANREHYYEWRENNTIIANRNNTVNIEMKPKAYVKFHLKNVKPFKNIDKIDFIGPWTTSNTDDIFYGIALDTVSIKSIPANKKSFIYFYVTKNYIRVKTKDSLFVKPLDTLYYKFDY